MNSWKAEFIAYFAVALGSISPAQSLVSWGDDTDGQVSNTPLGHFKAVSAGYFHSLALRSDGTLTSWGRGGAVIDDTPTGTFTAVSAGYGHSVALRPNGTLVSWGANYSNVVSDTPSGAFIAVSAGNFYSLGLKSDGRIVVWGDLTYVSQIPQGTFIKVSAGDHHAMAMKANGTILVWGTTQATLNGASDIQISAGFSHNLAIRPFDHAVLSFSSSSNATVRQGSYKGVACGERTDFAIRDGGTIDAWGNDANGLISHKPSGSFSAISCRLHHAVAIAVPESNGFSSFGFGIVCFSLCKRRSI